MLLFILSLVVALDITIYINKLQQATGTDVFPIKVNIKILLLFRSPYSPQFVLLFEEFPWYKFDISGVMIFT